MTQTALNFKLYPDNIFTPGTMNYRLYERLKQGPVLLSELHREMGMDTARMRDVRKYLVQTKSGLNIACRVIEKGETEYRIYG